MHRVRQRAGQENPAPATFSRDAGAIEYTHDYPNEYPRGLSVANIVFFVDTDRLIIPETSRSAEQYEAQYVDFL